MTPAEHIRTEPFHSPTFGRLSFPTVIQRIVSFVNEQPQAKYKLVIGTDSLAGNRGLVEYVSAIVVHRVGAGGIYFWQRRVRDKIFTLRDRIYREALTSLEVAELFLSDGRNEELFRENLEIHVDVGQAGPTKEMIAEIAGLVTGQGYRVRTKPDAYAATKVADRHNGIPVAVPAKKTATRN